MRWSENNNESRYITTHIQNPYTPEKYKTPEQKPQEKEENKKKEVEEILIEVEAKIENKRWKKMKKILLHIMHVLGLSCLLF